MTPDTAFVGVVTEDGQHVLPDQRAAFRQHVAKFAGQEVEIIVRRRPRRVTPEQRGYWQGVLVPAFQHAIGEESKYVAHRILLDLLAWLPGDPDPTTSDAGADRETMSDLIERASALLTKAGIAVAEPEPDPVRRWERRRMTA